VGLVSQVRPGGLPKAPTEIADAVELYAREWGRHAKIYCVPILFVHGRIERVAWVVRMTLRPDDKRLQLYQQGKVEREPTEDVWLVEPNPNEGQPISGAPGIREPAVVGLKIEELGAGGIREYLQRGNTWSGRGEHASLEEQARKAKQHNEEMRVAFREEQKVESRHEQSDKRRWRFRIPFLPVGIDLKPKKAAQGE